LKVGLSLWIRCCLQVDDACMEGVELWSGCGARAGIAVWLRSGGSWSWRFILA
jgi:hypothetical protein